MKIKINEIKSKKGGKEKRKEKKRKKRKERDKNRKRNKKEKGIGKEKDKKERENRSYLTNWFNEVTMFWECHYSNQGHYSSILIQIYEQNEW